MTPKTQADGQEVIVNYERVRGQAVLCFALALVKYTRLYFSGANDALASYLKYWNDTDICNITATCLSYVLYRRLDPCEPAFHKPRLIWKLLPPTFVTGGEFAVTLSNGDVYWSRGQPNRNR
jgi:hypothetical protein